MTCSVCGAETSAGSIICSSCDRIVGRGRRAPGNGQYPSSPADVSPAIAAIWSIVLLCATAWSAYLLYSKQSDPYSRVGAQIGHILAHVLLALITALLLRWLAKAAFLRTLLITWTILIPVTLVSMVFNNQQQRVQGLHQAAVTLSQVVNNKNPSSDASAATAHAATSTDRENASPLQIAIERATQNTIAFKQQEALRSQVQENLHLKLALTPERLVSAKGIAQSRHSFDQYRILIAEHQAALKAFEDQNQSYIMDMPQPTQAIALASFQKSRTNTDEAFNRFFRVENNYITTATQLLDVAQQAVGRSYLDKDGKLRLPEPMHTQVMSLAKTIHSEVVEETAAKENLQQLREQHLENMNHFLQQTSTP